MRNKVTAGLFALFMGTVGLHWFYLGQRTRGIFYFAVTLLTFMLSVSNNAPFILPMVLLVLIDALLLFSMPKVEFDEKYNAKFLKYREEIIQQNAVNHKNKSSRKTQVAGNLNKAGGIEKFKDYDYEGAITDFKLALAEKYDDPAVHFNLACCYSLLENPAPAFFHLSRAVQFGFVDFDKIDQHDALAFLRTQEQFGEFKKHGYQFQPALPGHDAGKEKTPSNAGEVEENLLEQIKRLSDLKNQGILTQEEFLVQTGKMLGK